MNTSTASNEKKSLLEIFNNVPLEVQQMARERYRKKHHLPIETLLSKTDVAPHITKRIGRLIMAELNIFIVKGNGILREESHNAFEDLYMLVEGEAA